MRGLRTWILLGLFAAGCGNGCGGTDEPSPASGGEPAATPGGDEAPDEPAPEPGPAPTVRVLGVVDARDRRVTPRVESLGPEPAEVGTTLGLQRQEGDVWEDVDATLHLRDSCDAEPTDCLTLAPGAVFLPPPWLGQIGDAQCACDECGPAPAGTYRFVVRGCAPSEPAEGEPFALP